LWVSGWYAPQHEVVVRRPNIIAVIVAVAVAFVSFLLVVGCASGGDAPQQVRTLGVPGQYPTIQAAVDDARPGDVVLIGEGTYAEAVEVTTDRLTIRGTNRNAVVLDGGHELVNGFTVASDGVAIENLTVHSYTQNGVVFSSVFAPSGDGTLTYGADSEPIDGYRVAYVTTYNNGLYGVYAFSARNGTIAHTYASGHPSSGFYVGQCKPCDVVLTDVVAERNAIGYYGTNASGGVYVVNSVFRANRIGVAPNSQRAERLAPQVETIVVGNLIEDNDDPLAPEVPDGLFGVGVAVGGGTRNTIERNVVRGHDGVGILVVGLDGFAPENNVVADNEVVGNAIDLGFDTPDGGRLGNCFADNMFATSVPADIEVLLPCGDASAAPDGLTPVRVPSPPSPSAPDYRTLPAPPPQPSMPDPTTVPMAVGPPTIPDVGRLTRPSS
jgi:hypothetical protein